MTPTLDRISIAEQLDGDGFAIMPPLLSPDECAALAGRFDDPGTRFRSTIDMARYNFGQGTYRYAAAAIIGPRCATASAVSTAAAGPRWA